MANGTLFISLEHFLQLIHEAPALRHCAAVLGGGEVAEQVLLLVRELLRNFYQNLDQLVAAAVGPQVGQSLTLELETLAVLGSGRCRRRRGSVRGRRCLCRGSWDRW